MISDQERLKKALEALFRVRCAVSYLRHPQESERDLDIISAALEANAVMEEIHAHRTVIKDIGICAPLMTPSVSQFYKTWCEGKNIRPVKHLFHGDYE